MIMTEGRKEFWGFSLGGVLTQRQVYMIPTDRLVYVKWYDGREGIYGIGEGYGFDAIRYVVTADPYGYILGTHRFLAGIDKYKTAEVRLVICSA